MSPNAHTFPWPWLKAKWMLPLLLIAFTAMHLGHIGKPLQGTHVQRQIAAHTIALNYAQSDPNLFHPQLNEQGHPTAELLHELPLHAWLTGLLHRLFGSGIAVARIFSLLVGLLAILGMHLLVKALTHHDGIAAATAWAFSFSPNLYYYSLTPTGDTFGLMLSIWALALFARWLMHPRNLTLGTSLGLMTLGAWCDSNLSIYGLIPFAYFICEAFRTKTDRETQLSRATLVALPTVFVLKWQAVMPTQPDGQYRPEISFWEKLGHHLAVTVPELMVNYATVPLLLIGLTFFFIRKRWRHSFALPLIIGGLGASVQLMFQMASSIEMHETALFILYPFLFLLVAIGLHSLLGAGKRWMMICALLMLLATPVTSFLRMNNRWSPRQIGFNADVMTYAAELKAASAPGDLWVVGNDPTRCAFLYHMGRKGWNFEKDHLPARALEGYMREGASYLLSDSRTVDTTADLQPLLGEPLLERGSLRLYKLNNLTR